MLLIACVRLKHISKLLPAYSLSDSLPVLHWWLKSRKIKRTFNIIQRFNPDSRKYLPGTFTMFGVGRGGWCGQGTHHLTVLTLPSMFPSEATDTVVYLPTSQQNASLSNEEAVIFLNTPPKPSFGWCLAVFILKRQEITPCRWGKHDRGHHYSSVARRKSPQGAQKNEKLFFFATDVYWFVRFIGSTP